MDFCFIRLGNSAFNVTNMWRPQGNHSE